MALPQTGIFALGNPSHAYLEFDLVQGADPLTLVTEVANLSEPRTTMGGVNLVTGFRPELWSAVTPARARQGLASFDRPVVGADGYTMPATQHDLALWIAGGTYDVVFDATIGVIAALHRWAALADETAGWSYHRDLDLTGFIDGTENPSLSAAPARAPTRMTSARSSGATLRTGRYANTARCSSASAPSSARSRRCSKAWPACTAVRATS